MTGSEGNQFAPCKGIRNPESNIFMPLESEIRSFGIRNPVPGIRNPTRGIRNPTSSITMESRSGMYYAVSSNYVTNHHLAPPLGVPYHHHYQKVFGHLTCTSNISTLRLGVFDSLLGTCLICLRSFFNYFSDMPSFLTFPTLNRTVS